LAKQVPRGGTQDQELPVALVAVHYVPQHREEVGGSLYLVNADEAARVLQEEGLRILELSQVGGALEIKVKNLLPIHIRHEGLGQRRFPALPGSKQANRRYFRECSPDRSS
jgi:hypothetical protein